MNAGKVIAEIITKTNESLKENEVGINNRFEALDGISIEELIPISFNNKVCMFISQKRLRDLGINHIEDLIGLNVTYVIQLPNKGLLFGHTTDVGERTHTYTKDARNKNSRFFNDFREYHNALFTVLTIGKTKEEVKTHEKNLIEGYKKQLFCERVGCNISDFGEYSKDEVNRIVSESIYNINNY